VIYYKVPRITLAPTQRFVGKIAASIYGELSDFPGTVKVVHLLSPRSLSPTTLRKPPTYSVGFLAKRRFDGAVEIRATSAKFVCKFCNGCDEKRKENIKGGSVENVCIAAGGNGRSSSQIVHNARSSAKASASVFPLAEITYVFLEFFLLA